MFYLFIRPWMAFFKIILRLNSIFFFNETLQIFHKIKGYRPVFVHLVIYNLFTIIGNEIEILRA